MFFYTTIRYTALRAALTRLGAEVLTKAARAESLAKVEGERVKNNHRIDNSRIYMESNLVVHPMCYYRILLLA